MSATELGVFGLLHTGRDAARLVVQRWSQGDLADAVNALEAWADEADALLNTSMAQYAEAVERAPEVGESYVVEPSKLPPGFSGHDDGDCLVGPLPDVEGVLAELDALDAIAATDPLRHARAQLVNRLPDVPESGDIVLPNGCRLYWQTDKSINCRVYSSDEIGGGVEVWNPALVAPSTLLAAIVCEEQLGNLEVIHAQRRNEGNMRRSAQTFSIFGQIEAAAAEVMIKSGEITRIEPERIPRSVSVNERDEPALFAVIVPHDKLEKFEDLIAKLRA